MITWSGTMSVGRSSARIADGGESKTARKGS
jgi:hypothetical protein